MIYVVRTLWSRFEYNDPDIALEVAKAIKETLKQQAPKELIKNSRIWVHLETWAGEGLNSMHVKSEFI